MGLPLLVVLLFEEKWKDLRIKVLDETDKEYYLKPFGKVPPW